MQTILCHLKEDGKLNGTSIAVIHEGDQRYIGVSVTCCTDQMNRMKGRLASIGRANMIRDMALNKPVHGKRKWLKTKTAVATYTDTMRVGFRLNVRDKKIAKDLWSYKEIVFDVPEWMLKPIPAKQPKAPKTIPAPPANI
jgi:hypothetical protein